MDRWKQSVRDEVYLIGERLHNHGERRPPMMSVSVGIQTDEVRGEGMGVGMGVGGIRRRGGERA